MARGGVRRSRDTWAFRGGAGSAVCAAEAQRGQESPAREQRHGVAGEPGHAWSAANQPANAASRALQTSDFKNGMPINDLGLPRIASHAGIELTLAKRRAGVVPG